MTDLAPTKAPGRASLPEPGLRLLGIASLGIGAGLFSAHAPVAIQLVAFVPALVAMTVTAVRSTRGGPGDRAPGDLPREMFDE